MTDIIPKNQEFVFAAFVLLVVHFFVSFGFLLETIKHKNYKTYNGLGWLISTLVVFVAAFLLGWKLYHKKT